MTTPPSVTLGDRIATAFVSVAAALVTFAAFAAILLLGGAFLEVPFWSRYLSLVGFLSAGAAILGFALGPKRMANVFGIAWGTVQPSAWQALLFCALALWLIFWLFST